VKEIIDYRLSPPQAALWWLGQAGYIIRSGEVVLAIDPYLSDAAAEGAPEFSRLYPPPLKPELLDVDVYVITHDHLDHLDPVTISMYRSKETTMFVAPRQAAQKLVTLGIAAKNIIILHAGESWRRGTMEITGVFALATSADVIDTTGYYIKFDNGRSIYHTSDTEYHSLVVAAAPKNAEVVLMPINGKWGNPGPDKAAMFAKQLNPVYVLPNHYDLMALNAENPEIFKWFCTQQGIGEHCIVPTRMEPFVWGS